VPLNSGFFVILQLSVEKLLLTSGLRLITLLRWTLLCFSLLQLFLNGSCHLLVFDSFVFTFTELCAQKNFKMVSDTVTCHEQVCLVLELCVVKCCHLLSHCWSSQKENCIFSRSLVVV